MKYLQSHPGIAPGELTITGTRIRIAQIFRMLANGMTIEYMAAECWPWLSPDTLRGPVDEAIGRLEADHPAAPTPHV